MLLLSFFASFEMNGNTAERKNNRLKQMISFNLKKSVRFGYKALESFSEPNGFFHQKHSVILLAVLV